MKERVDFLIAGSGFGGSILAACLAKSGFEVCMLEKGRHPRFTVGESSTPIADMVLRDLADRYKLPALNEISRYGEWQKHHPQLLCGLKRGFSYYPHDKGERFWSDSHHSRELLVAASVNDERSDTNWYRPDTDTFLVWEAEKAGVRVLEETDVTDLLREKEEWKVRMKSLKNGEMRELKTPMVIDATGSPAFSERFFRTSSSADSFFTNSSAIYSHFENAGRWDAYLNELGFRTDDYPYTPDHSALHHLIEEGWIWMLRFNNGLLSAGVVRDLNEYDRPNGKDQKSGWDEMIGSYPSIKSLFRTAEIADLPGGMVETGRLQRRLNRAFGDGWVALPHTAGFVDPLHSTGIAHTLCGVEHLLDLFTKGAGEEAFQHYEERIFSELELIDRLVSACYITRNSFRLFTASVMLYFAASIEYEQNRLSGSKSGSFLSADNSELTEMIRNIHRELYRIRCSGLAELKIREEELVGMIKESIEPYNRAGLMDDKKRNMYRHTAVEL